MKKLYRVDAFIGGKHSKRGFHSEEKALEYGERVSQRGEIVFLMKRMASGLYDVERIIQ